MSDSILIMLHFMIQTGRLLLQKLIDPITTQEVINAINALKNGKSPGPDGFCGEFFKEFQELLVDRPIA